MDPIDLRSDTVTWPTPAMREAMAAAEVGDDVKGEDPTINRLEAMAAERLGKAAALFVTSGTQGNIVALLTHCGRGDEAIVGNKAHIFRYEVAGAAALGGIQLHAVPVLPDGTLAIESIEQAIRGEDVHYPPTRLVCLENTQGSVGGMPITAAYTNAVRALCDRYALGLHIDGARIFNAAAALGEDVRELAAPADSVTFCLSKGLSAPVGSLLCGSADFIRQARRVRKMLGGGMRQGGVLAAAGIVALEQMTDRLVEDHQNASRLAEGIRAIDGLRLTFEPVRSNMVFFEVEETLPIAPDAFAAAMARHRILIGNGYGRSFRAVTHAWISEADIDGALAAMQQIVAQVKAGA